VSWDGFRHPAGRKIVRCVLANSARVAIIAAALGATDVLGANSSTASSAIRTPDPALKTDRHLGFTNFDFQHGPVVAPPSTKFMVAQSNVMPEPSLPPQQAVMESPMPSPSAISAPAAVEIPAPAPETTATLAPVPIPAPEPAKAAVEIKPLPPPPPTPAELLGLTGKVRAKAERCLANAIYFEARGEPVRGQIAVAQVVMNRVFSPYYPKDVCSVVYQNAHQHLTCQFTFACDGKRKAINERGAWARAQRIARQTLDGKVWVAAVAKSTHYHAHWVRPVWVAEMKKMFRYGVHTFYRPRRWGDGSQELGWAQAPALPPALPSSQKKPSP
jgi:spore germination cell wall hydrolase CwlJ-like protein